MRILHTSDWHLGRTFHGASLLDEQEEAVARIVAIARERSVELVVIAGDLFDRAIPPAPAVALLDRALAELHATGAHVVAISGNHDSPTRIGVNDRLLNQMGVAVRGDVSRLCEPLLIQDPADGGPPVAVYLLPYLEPVSAIAALAPAPADDPVDAAEADDADAGAAGPAVRRRATHHEVTELATDQMRAHLATLQGARSVLVAHTFVAGGSASESERDLSVGNIDVVGLHALRGFQYVALGHLHGPQSLDGERVAYSGTPLPYSFSEEHHTKSVRVVDLAPDGSLTVEVVPLEVGRKLATLEGPLQDLLDDPALAPAEQARVRVRLTDEHLPVHAMARLRSRFPHTVELRHEPAGAGPVGTAGIASAATIDQLAPLDLALLFWADQTGAPASDAVTDLLAQAIGAGDAEAGA